MIKKITLILSVLSILLLGSSQLVLADNTSAKEAAQCGANSAAGVSCDSSPSGNGLSDTVAAIINVLSVAVGAAAVIMIIYGGFRYVSSAGNDTATASARKTIIYAIVGLVIVALAQVIVHFVLNNISPTTTASNGGGSPAAGTCQNGHFVGGPNDGQPC
ncbi:MAG TPA: pilin [Candidatus Binatia bacterium]|nr:pilin [Candidatus Binatia bacterium]